MLRKWSFFVLALAMCLCLYGCRNESLTPELEAKNTSPSTNAQNETDIAETEPTKENISSEQGIEQTLSTEQTLPMETISWYETNRLIYHAGGAVGGMTYTNSQEAIENTLAAGNRLIEIDFLFTSDGQLVCLHEWKNFFGMTQPCTLEQFLSRKIFNRFTTISAESLIDYMWNYQDMYLVVDTKEKNLCGVIEELLRLCAYDSSVAERFVIQLYDAGMKANLMDLYEFGVDNFLFTTYKFGPDRVDEILNLCQEEEIRIVTVKYGFWDKATVQQFKDAGIFVFEHTVNDTIRTNNALARGIYGFYTDSLQDTDVWIDTHN